MNSGGLRLRLTHATASDRHDDLAELRVRIQEAMRLDDVIELRIASQRMVVCGARSYLRASGKPKSIDDLASHQAIIYRRSGRVRPWLFPMNDLQHGIMPLFCPTRQMIFVKYEIAST